MARRVCSLSPLAIRAFTPVFDGLLERVGVRGALHGLRLVERPPHPASPRKRGEVKTPQAGEGVLRDAIAMRLG
jgi:hypothetical protein